MLEEQISKLEETLGTDGAETINTIKSVLSEYDSLKTDKSALEKAIAAKTEKLSKFESINSENETLKTTLAAIGYDGSIEPKSFVESLKQKQESTQQQLTDYEKNEVRIKELKEQLELQQKTLLAHEQQRKKEKQIAENKIIQDFLDKSFRDSDGDYTHAAVDLIKEKLLTSGELKLGTDNVPIWVDPNDNEIVKPYEDGFKQLLTRDYIKSAEIGKQKTGTGTPSGSPEQKTTITKEEANRYIQGLNRKKFSVV